MVNILCYGDSNTFGSNPAGGRWPRDKRWPGILQSRLGAGYYVIEEGCGGRTTVMEDVLEPGRNGRTYLPTALHSHRPLDLVAIMLGTNDLKHRFGLLPAEIARGAAALGELAQRYDYGPDCPAPGILLISPIHIAPGIEHSPFVGFDPSAAERSAQLAPCYRAEAEAHGWLFLDAAQAARPSERDKLHMEAEDHLALARAVEAVVREAFPPR